MTLAWRLATSAAALVLGVTTLAGQAGAQGLAPLSAAPARPPPAASDCAALRDSAEWARQHRLDPQWNPRAVTDAESGGYEEWAWALSSVNRWLLATFVPHVGARLGAGSPEAVVSWPWSLPLGPDATCRLRNPFTYEGQKRHRALLEPGLLLGPHTGGFLRPGYRYLVHPGDGAFGLGAGLGTTVERLPGSPWRASVSPEVLVHHGACCSAGYATVAVRYDRFLAGRDRDMVTVSLGLTFF